jgi:hypothetical protein
MDVSNSQCTLNRATTTLSSVRRTALTAPPPPRSPWRPPRAGVGVKRSGRARAECGLDPRLALTPTVGPCEP